MKKRLKNKLEKKKQADLFYKTHIEPLLSDEINKKLRSEEDYQQDRNIKYFGSVSELCHLMKKEAD